MPKLASYLHDHRYPALLLRRPRLVRWLYRWNGLLLQRNWLTSRTLRKLLSTLPSGSHVVDAGCGEGLHLLPWAERYPKIQFTGIDRLGSHIDFGRRYAEVSQLRNVKFKQAELADYQLEKKAQLVTCIGILQYIPNDETVLKNIHNSLATNGLSIFYVPVNGRMLLPSYRYFFGKKMHYERSQRRVRVYSEDEFLAKLKNTGFRVREQILTYGTLGILGHETYSLLLMGMGNAGWFGWVFGLLLVPLLPGVLLLKWVDFSIKKNTGNGMLVIAEKTKI